MKSCKYLIAGNGAAAVGAVEGIRSIDKSGEILILSEEKHCVYSRPLISYLLLGKTDEERMKYRPESFYDKMGCRILYGVRAEKLSAQSKTVTASDSCEYGYEKLLAATGSRPFVPPMEGIEKVSCKSTFMTLDDARFIDTHCKKDSRVLIIGAGLIGLKCAEGLLERTKNITVVDMAPQILPSILDPKCETRVRNYLEDKGITFILGDSAASFPCDGSVILKSGKELVFDLLVIAVGVRANTSLLSQAGAETNRGTVVGTDMATSLPGVYAAGDCCEGYDITFGKNRVLAIMPNAFMGGYTAGVNMAGGSAVFDNAFPENSLGLCGLHIASAGSYDGDERIYEKDGTHKAFYIKDGILNGFIIIGDVSRCGIYTALVRNRTPLETLDFDTLMKEPGLMPFCREDRAAMLAQAH